MVRPTPQTIRKYVWILVLHKDLHQNSWRANARMIHPKGTQQRKTVRHARIVEYAGGWEVYTHSMCVYM